ncbi:ubiquinone biosynthesis monooxygenase COQ6, mitochondrial [Senna tora]|uniref:Ubiquinone biosynthesis monooxygenase COQ6, mitochondrial n=1 Tax=Senna tora TaxID=362788 RepID=A0A834X328_9FABA|nr:ubiquinone biosynthesis monooxygenase COQ6, mitochondrial [Senna tora]
MNRAISNKFVTSICRLKVHRKSFCTEAAKVAGSSSEKLPNEHEKKQTISSIQQYDVAIVGGGMVGMALACFLASMPMTKQLNVAIIDSNPALRSGLSIKKDEPPDARVSTVTPATIASLRDAGAWQYVEQHRHAYFDKMQVLLYSMFIWAMLFNHLIIFMHRSIPALNLRRDWLATMEGCVVENKVLHNALLSCIEDTDFQKTIYPLRLTSMNLQPSSTPLRASPSAEMNLAKLELSDGSNIYAKLVVGADGGKSRTRELAGFRTSEWNYTQNAIICTVEHAIENQCAWQRFLPSGPIALLPIGDKFSNIVWTMKPTESDNRKSMNDDDFVKELNSALDYGYGPHPKSSLMGSGDMFSWLKRDTTISANQFFEIPPKVVKLASQRMVFPLSLRHAKSYASKRVVLIGDAAHTVHPLAGQGVNLGFGDAFALSRIIAEGIAVGSDIGEVHLLKKYETERKPANVMMMAILESIQKAYAVDFGPLNVLRAAAFHGANNISPLKRSIISYASGEQKLPLFS